MNPVLIEVDVQENNQSITAEMAANNYEYEIGTSEGISGGTKDYQKLINKPSINGTELFDNYDERDPTVHDWAKEPSKPTYTAEEVGAIDEDNEMSLADVKKIWDSVFNKGG